MRKLLALLLLCASQVFGAGLLSTTVWEVRVAGDDTNGGGYVTGGTDYSRQNAKNANGGTNGSSVLASTNGTTTLTCSDCQFTSAVNGNVAYIVGGSGSIAAQRRQLTFASATTVTIDTAIATSTGMTINIGGALHSLGGSCVSAVAGNILYFLNAGSAFTITSASSNVSEGVCNTGSIGYTFVGYVTNRLFSNTDSPPTVQTNVNSATQITTAGVSLFYNFIFDGNGGSAATGGSGTFTASKLAAGGGFQHCQIKNFNTATTGSTNFFDVFITTNTASIVTITGSYVTATANIATPVNGQGPFSHILSYANTGASTDGVQLTQNSTPSVVSFVTSVGNGRYGITTSGSGLKAIDNSYFQDNANVGLNCSAGSCYTNAVGYYNNNSGGAQTLSTGTTLFATGTPTVTADAFISKGTGNYALNNLTGAGAALKAAGMVTTFNGSITPNAPDIGAAQSVAVASGGGSYAVVQ